MNKHTTMYTASGLINLDCVKVIDGCICKYAKSTRCVTYDLVVNLNQIITIKRHRSNETYELYYELCLANNDSIYITSETYTNKVRPYVLK
jgi:hypothetical protein